MTERASNGRAEWLSQGRPARSGRRPAPSAGACPGGSMQRSRRSAAGLTPRRSSRPWPSCSAAFVAAPRPATVVADEDDPERRASLLTEPLALEDFLKAVGKHAEFPLYWDPKSRALQNKEVIGARNLKAPRSELFNLVRALLTFYELVLIPVGPQGYEVYLVMDARQTAAHREAQAQVRGPDRGRTSTMYENQDGLFLTTTIRVENMTNLRDARNALNRIVTRPEHRQRHGGARGPLLRRDRLRAQRGGDLPPAAGDGRPARGPGRQVGLHPARVRDGRRDRARSSRISSRAASASRAGRAPAAAEPARRPTSTTTPSRGSSATSARTS